MTKKPQFSISALYVVAFCTISSMQMTAVVMAIYAKDYLFASTVEIGIIVSAFFLTGLFWRIPAGILIRGSRTIRMFLFAVVLNTISPLLYVLAPDPLFLMGARVVHAVGFAMYVPMALGIVALLTPPSKRGTVMGKYTAAGAGGLMAGPTIGSVGVRLFGFQNLFFIASLDAGIALMLVLIVLLPKIRQVIQAEDSVPFRFKEIPEILSNKVVITAFFGYFSILFVYSTNLAFTPIYAKDFFQLPEDLVAGLFSGYFLFSVIVRVFLGRMTARWGAYKLIIFGLLNSALMSFIMFIAKTSLIVFLVAFFLMGISHGLVFPIGMVLISNAVKRSQLFLANSLYFFGFDVGGTIGPLITAFIVIRLGIPPTFAIIALVPLCVAILASQLLSKVDLNY